MVGPSLFSEDESVADLVKLEAPRGGSSKRDRDARVSTTSLYRKYRPQSFADEELVGQDQILRALRNAVLLDRVGHAYLFSGPRGTGKTTTARVLAKAVNCLDPDPANRPCNQCDSCRAITAGAAPDVIEIDAASNRGIDDIRDLRERVRYAPAQLRSKVYIIDEAHQITGAAANAFLKTLEEPPSHSKFILATTDPEELLPTIVSRCQRFQFRRVSVDAIVMRMRAVADREQIRIDDDALQLLARQATGSMRDALGLLERLAPLSAGAATDELPQIGLAEARDALGLSRNERVESLVTALANRSASEALDAVQAAIDAGEDPRQLNRQLVSFLRSLLIERAGGISGLDDNAKALTSRFSLVEIAGHARRFAEIDFAIKHAPYPQLPLEIALVEASLADHQKEPAENLPDAGETQAAALMPTSLRDRVRAPAPNRHRGQSTPLNTSHSDPVPIAAFRAPTQQDAAGPPAADAGALAVSTIAELWPNVRADVKALNRRIEALLSEVDPVAISGNQITLAVPYPFHRDKLNTEEVRETVGGVLSRLLGREISMMCVLRSELSNYAPGVESPSASTLASTLVERDPLPADAERDLERLQAAKNIFDAEETDNPFEGSVVVSSSED